MAFVDFITAWPQLHHTDTAFNAKLIDASAEKVAFLFQAPKAGTLDGFQFGLGTVGTAPSSGLKCSFQDPDASNGDPDGTADEYRVVTSGLTSNTWVDPGILSSDGTDGGTKRTVTRGQWLYAVIEFESFDAGDSLNINTQSLPAATGGRHGMVNVYIASWALDKTSVPNMALLYNDATFGRLGPSGLAAESISYLDLGADKDPDEAGLKFQVPLPIKVDGLALDATYGANASWDMVIYDGSDVEQGSTTIDGDMHAGSWWGGKYAYFDSEIELAADTDYRIVIKPSTSGSAMYMEYYETGSPVSRASNAAASTNLALTYRTNGGSWTDSSTAIPFMSLLISEIDPDKDDEAASRFMNAARIMFRRHRRF